MKYTKLFSFLVLMSALFACEKELDVQNPNQPTVGSAGNEQGIISLATGVIYQNGFRGISDAFYDGVPGYFWTSAVGFHELMGDVIGAEAANAFMNQVGCPNEVIFDDGSKVLNPNSPKEQKTFLRSVNKNQQQAANPSYHEWMYMYSMINGCNNILSLAEKASFSGNAAAKKATLQAWAYWWKGYAYSRIGSIYYAGIINNTPGATNGNYVTKEQIIAEANANLDKAATAINGLDGNTDYLKTMGLLIPSIFQTGKGNVPSPAEWKRNINTLKARNIVVNSPVGSTNWQSVLTLVNDGIKAGDNVFTARSNGNGDILNPLNGTVAFKSTGNPGSVTYKISERLIQDFKAGDKRLTNNFNQLANAWIGNADRGNSINTRWGLADKGTGIAGTIVYSNREPGATEHYLAGTYEENELMKAEALINTGNVSGGLAIIDAVRNAQGAGLASVSGATLEQAKEELRRERRVALAFRGLSFYDARRWGVIENGRKGAVVVDGLGKVNTNCTINYGFLDYWDVPENELAYNPVANGAVVVNPK
jgi:starch-binding outer membrane protein, SusD/RagB family